MAAERYVAAAQLLTDEAASRRGGLLIHAALLRRYMDIGESAALADEAVGLGEGRDAALVAFGMFVQGWLRSMTIQVSHEGIAPMEAGIAALEALPAAERAPFVNYLGYGVEVAHCRAILVYRLTLLGRFHEARALGERLQPEELASLVASSPFEDPQGYLAFGLGIVFAAFGEPDAARGALVRASARFRASGQFAIYGTCATRQLGWLHMTYTTDDLAEREQLIAEITEAYTAAALAMTPDLTRAARLFTAFLEGAWDDIADTPPTLFSTVSPTMQVEHAQLAHARGEHERAWEHVRAVFPNGPPDHVDEYRLTLRLIQIAGALALDAGDLTAARVWLQAHDRWQESSGCVPLRAEGELLWTRYEWMLGHRTQARQRAEQALTLASAPRQPLALIAAHRLLGELETEGRRFDVASEHLAASLALATACRAPYERALTLLALAELHIATGRTAEARGTLDEVRAICEPLGARPALSRADALAARLDAMTTASPPYPADLTEREVVVLRLVAQGLTNAQAGEQLFLSPRTVEFHLRSIYGKLGVSSRLAATRFAIEHDLT
jgi:DNA-binding CsgD family transcriptional regulator